MEKNSPIVTVVDDDDDRENEKIKIKSEPKGPPIIIHDEIDRRPKDLLYYSMKLVSGHKNRYGKIGISEYHLTISKKPPKEADHCYAFSPAALLFGDQIEIKLTKYTGGAYEEMAIDAFLDKDRVRAKRELKDRK